jgi:hypothetical protein
MRGRYLFGSIGVIVGVLGATGAAARAGDGDDDAGAELAEAQFEVFLLTTTEYTPTDITCTRPPTRHDAGDLLCYALIAPRASVAAIATLESPGVYRFMPLHKVDPADLGAAPAQPAPQTPPPESPDVPQQPQTPSPSPSPAPAPQPQNATDEAILALIDTAVADPEGLGEVIIENNDQVTSIDTFTYDAATSTLQLTVTTTATDPGVRDAIAFSITNIIAFLWEDDEPLRQPDATILPSFSVTVDGTTYTTPFDVMVRVADYTISQTEWLDIVTGEAAFRRAGRR